VLAGLGDQKLRGLRVRLLDSRRHNATMASTMLDVKVDRSEGIALHDQVAAEIRRAIAAGEASPGERLPPAKDLAAVLGVNTNTVLRALRILRDEGLLDFRRGRGVTVAGTANEGAAIIEKVRELLEFARFHGYRSEDVVEIVQSLS
jgi:GntR family transcriptional regulator